MFEIFKIKRAIRHRKHTLYYGDPKNSNGVYCLNCLNLNDFDIETNVNGIYAIFDDTYHVYYIGIGQNLRSRLMQHLIKNNNLNGTSSKTHSKIGCVYELLMQRKKEGKPLAINYSFVKTKKYVNRDIEGRLIDYFTAKNQAEWNKKH
jgi:predicted GIY-YIG superfamily endonuclease